MERPSQVGPAELTVTTKFKYIAVGRKAYLSSPTLFRPSSVGPLVTNKAYTPHTLSTFLVLHCDIWRHLQDFLIFVIAATKLLEENQRWPISEDPLIKIPSPEIQQYQTFPPTG